MNLTRFLPACTLVLGCSSLHAQGIPVIDSANLAQTIQQVINDVTEIQNQVQQIQQLQAQLTSINGSRMLGAVFDDPRLRNYVPADAYTSINAVVTSGYAGLGSTGRTLRNQGMVYNCEDLAGTTRTNCQAALALPYQHKGLLQDAMHAASGRLGQIEALMQQINATSDQKAVQEIQARISAENALLGHEVSQIQMLQGMADSDERVERSRDREQQYERLKRDGVIAKFLP